jgi:outer membrane immunogenic protein
MRYCVLAAVIAAALATPAIAQGPVSFNGPRVEAIVGYDSVDIADDKTSGILYGAGIGYDFGAGGAVLGLEAEYTDSAAKECFDNFGGAGSRLCTEAGRDVYVGARAGAQLASNSLLYVKAGYTNARLETAFSSGVVGAGVDRRFKLDGYRLGAGAEFALTPGSYVKAEYRYSHYGLDKNDFVGGTALNPVNLPGDNHHKHQAVAGLGLRF